MRSLAQFLASKVSVGDVADLILVFFDPIGQALCRRTLDIVERLNNKYPDRIRFYLSKTDEAGSEGDRQVRSRTRCVLAFNEGGTV